MGSTSTQPAEVSPEPRQDDQPSNTQPLAEPKTKKPRFSITIVSQVPG
jgi:hypothetical protein